MKKLTETRPKVSLAILILGLAAASFATAADLNVPADYPTIQAAVNAAVSGDEIQIAAGVYHEQIVVSRKNLTITGQPGTIIQAWDKMVHSRNFQWYILFEFFSSDVTVSNIDFEGNRASKPNVSDWISGLFYGDSGGRVQDCVIRGFRGTNDLRGVGLNAYTENAVAPRVVDLQVSHNTFADNGRDMWIEGDRFNHPGLLRMTVSIEDNSLTGIGPTALGEPIGIQIEPSVAGTIKNNQIAGYYYSGPSNNDFGFGIAAYDSARFLQTTTFPMQPLRFENNTFGDNQVALAAAKCDNGQFINNFFQGSGGGLTSSGLWVSGTNFGVSFNQFTNLTRGIVLNGKDPVFGTALGIARNAAVINNRFCTVATNVVFEPLVTGVTEQGSLTCPFPDPALAIATAVILSWPNYAIGWTLESAPDPQGPWTSLDVAPSVQDGQYVFAVKTAGQPGFFRLRQPSGQEPSSHPHCSMKTNAYFTFLVVLLACLTRLQAASTIQFTAKSYTVPESAGAKTLTVQRFDDTDTAVSVDYATTNLTATAGFKYTAISGTLAFASGKPTESLWSRS